MPVSAQSNAASTTTSNTEAGNITVADPKPELDIDKKQSAPPGRVAVGEEVTYAIVINNTGAAAAQGVVMQDTLPLGFNPVSTSIVRTGNGPTHCGGVSCQLGTMAAGEIITITLIAAVDATAAPGFVINTATVFSSSPEDNLNNNTDTAQTEVRTKAALAITKQDVTDPVVIDGLDDLTYIINVRNLGPSYARNVVISDTLPDGLVHSEAPIITTSFATDNPSGTCPYNAKTAACTLDEIPVGETVDMYVVASVIDANLCDSRVTNAARVTWDDTNGGGYRDDGAKTLLICQGALSLTKEGPNKIGPTDDITYTLTVANTGQSPIPASELTLTDALPSGVTYVDAREIGTHWCGFQSGDSPTTWVNEQPLSAGRSCTIELVARASNATCDSSIIVNTARATDQDNNVADASKLTEVDCATDLHVEKFGPATAIAGELITYRINVVNKGAVDANLVDIADDLPDGVTLQSATLTRANGDPALCAGASCHVSKLAVGEQVTVTIQAKIDAALPAGTIINKASAVSDTPDKQPTDNVATVETAITSVANLHIDKVDLIDPVVAGGNIFYEITVRNDGPSTARSLMITDTVPTMTQFVGASPICTERNRVVTCTTDLLAPGQARSVMVQVQINGDAPDQAVIRNVAHLRAENGNTGSATAETTVYQLPDTTEAMVDLAISQQATPDPVTAGETIQFTLVITNNGPGDADNVSVVDALPAELTIISAQSSQGICNTSVICDLGDLAANATATIEIEAQISSRTSSAVTNIAIVSSNSKDSDQSNNRSTANADVVPRATLNVLKTGPASVIAGTIINYELAISNDGPSDAQSVVVSDTLPALLVHERATATASQGACLVTGADVVCTLNTVPAGQTATVHIQAPVKSSALDVIHNTAFASSITDSASVRKHTTNHNRILNIRQSATQASVQTQADLRIEQSAAATVIAGGQISYRIEIHNHGPSDARDVTVVDILPAGVTFDADANSPSCVLAAAGQDTIICDVGALANGATASLDVVVDVNDALEPGTSLANRTTVAAVTDDPNAANDQQ